MYGALVTVVDSLTKRAGTALLAAFRPPTTTPSTQSVLRSVLWPLALMSLLHRAVILPLNGNITDDFKPVYRAVLNFRHGLDIYNEHFDYVDPHYLYSPGGTLLMAPFGFLPETLSRYTFIATNTVAILIAAYLLLRIFDFSLTSVAAPALLAAMFLTESVSSTLVFTNINGVILLAEVLFLRWLLDGRADRQWWAGIAIGLSLVVKPVLAPLLLLPLLSKQWRPFVGATAVPVLFNVAAFPLTSHPMDYFTHTVPYLTGTRDYFNSSILGNGVFFGLPASLIAFMRVLFTVIAAVSLWLLARYYRTRDPRLWMLTSSGVLLTASFLVLSLGQGYYSIVLFPFLMTVVLPNSVLRNWPAWLAIYGFMTLDKWLIFRWMVIGRPLDYLKITYGWSLLLIVVCAVLCYRYLDAREEGRLDDGIDPGYLDVTPSTSGTALEVGR